MESKFTTNASKMFHRQQLKLKVISLTAKYTYAKHSQTVNANH